ncbi:MAG: IPT/TIG domain-containing protein [Bacteroidetes bacterium]|nr:IPT/TIG domain-containing protein [Bacteroidota bacterium]
MKRISTILTALLLAVILVACSEQDDFSNPTGEDVSSVSKKPSTAPTGPVITSVSPAHAEIGEEITITGSGFGPKYKYATNYVLVHGVRVSAYTSWSQTQIRFPAPSASVITGAGPVVVYASSVASNADKLFTYDPSSNITIGLQTWSGANLNVSKFRDNTDILYVDDSLTWANTTGPAWCYYDNDPLMGQRYGKLYNWYAVSTTAHGGIAPVGEHIPTDAEWTTLAIAVGADPAFAPTAVGWFGTNEGGKLREVGYSSWSIPNEGATNQYGFTLLPGGYRLPDGHFYGMAYYGPFMYGLYGAYWCADENPSYPGNGWCRFFDKNRADMMRGSAPAGYGFSVRTIIDN